MSENRLTWAEFKDKVYSFLPEEASRQNVGIAARTYTEATFDLHMRAAVRNLQSHVPHYQIGHETIYHAADFVLEGYAARAVLPPAAEPNDAWLCARVSDRKTDRRKLTGVDWKRRFAMIHGHVSYNDGMGCISIDREGYTFYVSPYPMDCQVVSLFWSGKKSDFDLQEETPFDEDAADAVASYVQAQLTRGVDKDITLSNAAWQDFIMKRRDLFITGKNRSRLNT
jgi:hypothetical protein